MDLLGAFVKLGVIGFVAGRTNFVADPVRRRSGDVPTLRRAEVWGCAPRLRVGKLGCLLALSLCLISLGSLERGCRSDGRAVARETRPTIHWHGH